MVSILGAALVVLGLLAAGAAMVLQGEVATACASGQGRVGTLLGAPDAQACQSYPPLLSMALLVGLGVAGLGALLLVLRR